MWFFFGIKWLIKRKTREVEKMSRNFGSIRGEKKPWRAVELENEKFSQKIGCWKGGGSKFSAKIAVFEIPGRSEIYNSENTVGSSWTRKDQKNGDFRQKNWPPPPFQQPIFWENFSFSDSMTPGFFSPIDQIFEIFATFPDSLLMSHFIPKKITHFSATFYWFFCLKITHNSDNFFVELATYRTSLTVFWKSIKAKSTIQRPFSCV